MEYNWRPRKSLVVYSITTPERVCYPLFSADTSTIDKAVEVATKYTYAPDAVVDACNTVE